MNKIPPQWKYVARDIVITYQRIHTLAIKRGTRAERRTTGTGPSYTVHRHEVELLSKTQALFDHDSTYYYIWIGDDDLVEEMPANG